LRKRNIGNDYFLTKLRVLVVWRKLTGDPEKDNLMLDEWF
jgi:hypothetical protein